MHNFLHQIRFLFPGPRPRHAHQDAPVRAQRRDGHGHIRNVLILVSGGPVWLSRRGRPVKGGLRRGDKGKKKGNTSKLKGKNTI